jgi:hypothetical protein
MSRVGLQMEATDAHGHIPGIVETVLLSGVVVSIAWAYLSVALEARKLMRRRRQVYYETGRWPDLEEVQGERWACRNDNPPLEEE